MTAQVVPERGTGATFNRLSDTLLLGLAVAVTSLGVVTAGPALLAAARVVRGWAAGDQPPLVATFRAALRETPRLLLPQLALAAVLGVLWVDLVVAGAGLPGAWLVRAVAALAGLAAVASYLAMFPLYRTGSWWTAWARAARLCARRPWLPVALAGVTGLAVFLVAFAPATVVVAAGPWALAVGVLTSRAEQA